MLRKFEIDGIQILRFIFIALATIALFTGLISGTSFLMKRFADQNGETEKLKEAVIVPVNQFDLMFIDSDDSRLIQNPKLAELKDILNLQMKVYGVQSDNEISRSEVDSIIYNITMKFADEELDIYLEGFLPYLEGVLTLSKVKEEYKKRLENKIAELKEMYLPEDLDSEFVVTEIQGREVGVFLTLFSQIQMQYDLAFDKEQGGDSSRENNQISERFLFVALFLSLIFFTVFVVVVILIRIEFNLREIARKNLDDLILKGNQSEK